MELTTLHRTALVFLLQFDGPVDRSGSHEPDIGGG
jgi:hypothetical protein